MPKNLPIGKSNAIKEIDEYGNDESELIFDKKIATGDTSPCDGTLASDKINDIEIRPNTQFRNYIRTR